DWHFPREDWLRVDSGVEPGSEVSIHYDPMLAKVIAWGPTRIDAAMRLRWALAHAAVQGLRTNRDFLIRVLDDQAFLEGELSTHFIEDRFGDRLADGPPDQVIRDAALVAALAGNATRSRPLPSMRSGFRNSAFADQQVQLRFGDDREIAVNYRD